MPLCLHNCTYPKLFPTCIYTPRRAAILFCFWGVGRLEDVAMQCTLPRINFFIFFLDICVFLYYDLRRLYEQVTNCSQGGYMKRELKSKLSLNPCTVANLSLLEMVEVRGGKMTDETVDTGIKCCGTNPLDGFCGPLEDSVNGTCSCD